jgi:hypothetical protein
MLPLSDMTTSSNRHQTGQPALILGLRQHAVTSKIMEGKIIKKH